MNKWSDEQLLEQLLAGKTAALDALYQRYADKLFVFCQHITNYRDRQSAEDLVQDVFLRVINSAKTFDSHKAAFRTWLFTIARNRCFDFNRRRARIRFESLDPVDNPGAANETPAPLEQIPHPDADVENTVLKSNRDAAIADCLERLNNPDEREAILLYYLDDRVLREIAETLNCSISTARNRITAAKESLRQCLKAKGYESTTA